MRKLFFVCVLIVYFALQSIFTVSDIQAQWAQKYSYNTLPYIDSVSPGQNRVNISLNSYMKVWFKQSLNSSTIDSNSITFFGSMTGRKRGNISYNPLNKSMQLVPVSPFKYGEIISTTLDSGIKTSAGNPIVPFVWNFTTKSKPVNINFNVFDVLNTGTGSGPAELITGDFDGDGDLDLAVILNTSGYVSIFKNNGYGVFVQTSTIYVGTMLDGIATGDFDGDGDLDIAVTAWNYDPNNLTILTNNGAGSFTVSSVIPAGPYLFGVTAADFDGDGDIDLAVSSFYTGLSILINNGTGTFSLRNFGFGNTKRIASADFDGDGDIDIALGTQYSNLLYICKNDGNGIFTVSSTITIPNEAITMADFDGDGDMDIALTGHAYAGDIVSILKNDGSGTFTISSTFPGSPHPTVIITADFDGDGDMDLAASDENVILLKNNGTGSFTSSIINIGNYLLGLAAGDFNGDGVLDLAVANNNLNTVSILSNLSSPQLLSPANNSTGCLSSLNFTWYKSFGASNYRLQVSTDSLFSNLVINDSTLSGTDSVKFVSGLNALTWYYWRMNAKSGNGTSMWTDTWKFKTQGVPTQVVLSAPANNSVNQPRNTDFKWFKSIDQTLLVKSSEFRVKSESKDKSKENLWDSPRSVLNYWFEFSIDSTFATGVVRDSLLTDTTKSLSGLNNLTKYYWRVKSKNQTGWNTFSSVWNFTTVPPIPSSPTLISPPNNATNLAPNVLLDWSSVNYASGYRVQISNDSIFTSMVYDTSSVNIDSLRIRPGILLISFKYYWKVNASNAAGTGVWSTVWNFRINTVGLITSENLLPKEFRLYENYPNPFNPVTKIKFDIAKLSNVKILVYDVMGREVQTLVNERLQPGTYVTTFDGSRYSSGVYYYIMQTNDFREVKRMVMIK